MSSDRTIKWAVHGSEQMGSVPECYREDTAGGSERVNVTW